jgi:hypothetical protein
LANADRRLEAILAEDKQQTVYDLIVSGDTRVEGLDLNCLQVGDLPLVGIRENENELVADDLLFRISVPNQQLRLFLVYMLQRLNNDDPDASISTHAFGDIKVPDDLGPVVKEIEQIRKSDAQQGFEQALTQIDELVASAFGVTHSETTYIIDQMKTDSFLKQLRPMYEQRGFREQPYADHSGSDRYN